MGLELTLPEPSMASSNTRFIYLSSEFIIKCIFDNTLNEPIRILVQSTYSQLNQLRKISAKYLFEEAKKAFLPYDVAERDSILHVLFEDLFQIFKIDLVVNKEIDWDEDLQLQLDLAVQRLNNLEPVQYVVGKAYFFNSYFQVNASTLIPRPETEELVQLIIYDTQIPNPKIIDIGTGSGCIAISLAANIKGSSVTAVDISVRALETAALNAKALQVEIDFIEADFLQGQYKIGGQFDIIVSNPPYVLESEKEHMRENVLAHEPHLALFVEDTNAMVYYEALMQFASRQLNPSGYVYAEINEQKGQEMIALATQYGFSKVEIIKDFFGKDRMFKAHKI